MPEPSSPEWPCAVTSLLCVKHHPAQLDMLLVEAPAGSNGACLSQLGRVSLSRLATYHGFDCPVSDWSPRGSGVPHHPALPLPWQACLTHSGRWVAAGLATVPVGIDMEHTRPRHKRRLDALIALLPETKVRHAIRESLNPMEAFYQAWTCHEALFKLDSLAGSPASHVLATRLSRLHPNGDIHAWRWQDAGWTISICSRHSRLHIRSLPRLPLKKVQSPLISAAVASQH